MGITTYFLLVLIVIQYIFAASLWEAYNSDAQQRRREGMKEVRFRPLLHLRGEDDYRTLAGQEALFINEDVDENGIFMSRRSWKSAPTNPLGGIH
ncbi:hypothetical protein PFISCL1PPCAC_27532 [Pristionchus fissidentatus]|uniref:Uncharacterized protein n=1 Tax=Pristionchus fissidentatus TaxID=1538716 RepID=A0AAV5X026_9BILA|nr:hypothetical protein PFISCL1PPCAC_27532 [Pristionchus fissidentatus]